MKNRKNYRFSNRTMDAIQKLKEQYPAWTETELIETAIQNAASRLNAWMPQPFEVVPVTNAIVTNSWGRNDIDFDAAVNLMDDDIREDLHQEMAPCSEQEFFDAYCKRHKEVFGEDFVCDTPCPQY